MKDPLAGERYISLATFRKNGKAVETPIWFAELGGAYYGFSESRAGKIKRLRNFSRSRVAACDVRGRLRGEWLDTETHIVEDPETQKRAYGALRAKYGIQMHIGDFFARLSGRIHKRAVLEIRLAMAALLSVVLAAATPIGADAQSGSSDPYTVVLGIAQDGGYPQAGSDSPAWADASLRRLVSSLAVVDPASGERWLFDATPDLKWQLRRLDEIAPRASEAPVFDGILLTHAHVGHYSGLLQLGKEVMNTSEVPVWAMPRMLSFLRDNGPWGLLVEIGNIVLRPLTAHQPVQLNDRLTVTPIPVPHRDEYSETVGFVIDGPNRSIFFLPDIDKWEAWDESVGEGAIERILERVDTAYLDGSFYGDGEVPGRVMSEIRHPFISESLERFGKRSAAERAKVRFIHLNRTNPAITPGSAAQRAIRAAGFGLAEEGEKIRL